MKFGKRLGAEAARGWKDTYLDYKACKRAVRQDVEAADPSGSQFDLAIQRELQKITAFFSTKEEELEAMMRSLPSSKPAVLPAFRAQVLDLRKYAVLNATGVIKAVKKRNRHLRSALGRNVKPLLALDLLSQQHFFTSPKLAALSTRAEVLSKEVQPREDATKMLEDYECPICLCVLQNPVVLTCAHRFCWGCLLSHCATNQDRHNGHEHGSEEEKPGSALLKAIAEDSSASRAATYGCPVCRQAHILDLDRLQVDQTLVSFIETLRVRQTKPPLGPSASVVVPPGSAATAAATTELIAPPSPGSNTLASAVATPSTGPISAQEIWTDSEGDVEEAEAAIQIQELRSAPAAPLLPPQTPAMTGRLTVVLDLDGTLISSYTPRRAPSLPPGSKAYVVGKGAKLNPNGVLVVERPELATFFDRLNKFAEVVLFTAGLEDYAAPICKALERQYSTFTATLFRPATVACDAYPCVKDLSRLGRDLKRTVLIDDTPLAFLRQPDNGVPIFSFRGDVDDRVLPEAILPLLEHLAASDDVRPILHRRFDMPRWLISHGIASSTMLPAKALPSPVKRQLDLRPNSRPASAEPETGRPAAPRRSDTLILSDFDKTVTDCDAGERLVGELAPELAPMLASIQMPANFVPLTNAVLAEMARRGISRDRILNALRGMGAEIPASSLELFRWAERARVDLRLISDCNTVFIDQILKGAGMHKYVGEVITNSARFERSMTSDSAKDLTELASWGGQHTGLGQRPAEESSLRLVIQPRQEETAGKPHDCPLCPANLCKGLELRALQSRLDYPRIIYCGDGANDLCPALHLRPNDVLLARKGFTLDKLAETHKAGSGAARTIQAKVLRWQTHEELFKLARQEA